MVIVMMYGLDLDLLSEINERRKAGTLTKSDKFSVLSLVAALAIGIAAVMICINNCIAMIAMIFDYKDEKDLEEV